MGASGWEYVIPYDGSVEAALGSLHAQVFQEEYGDGEMFGSLEELYEDEEFMGEEGTHSILDIQRVVHTTDAPSELSIEDYGTLRPLSPDRVAHHFGTGRPTRGQFEEVLAEIGRSYEVRRGQTLIDECRMRWTGLYVILHTGGEPTHLGIFGYSGD
ncbi:hypothetical protein [Streptomyces sp. NPDC058614]|uniref:hypothetical protein n=1 Tax=Streptomyces sp. NPDC058614 TaxID=3346557 RepID=UPI0036672D74